MFCNQFRKETKMFYTAFSLNGTWKMAYQEDKYLSERLPEFKGATIADAVPGYWEDMTDKFCKAEFYRTLRTRMPSNNLLLSNSIC